MLNFLIYSKINKIIILDITFLMKSYNIPKNPTFLGKMDLFQL